MTPHQQIIEEFFAAFADHNPDGMISCYHKDAVFHDPAFGTLQGDQIADMWQMLIKRSNGHLDIAFYDIKADFHSGSAKWTAKYRFGRSGRPVINEVTSNFEFEDGLIIKHTDYFDIWKWSRQALGIKGLLLGWTGYLQGKIQQQARMALRNAKK
jgi:limonene-1,2-epoxide hydrolase